MNELTVMAAPVDPRFISAHCRVWEIAREGKRLTLRIDCPSKAGFRLIHGVTDREVVSHNAACEAAEFEVKLRSDELDHVWFISQPHDEVEHHAADKPRVPITPNAPQFITLDNGGLKVR